MHKPIFSNPILMAKRTAIAGMLALAFMGCQSSTDANLGETASIDQPGDLAEAARAAKVPTKVAYRPGPLAGQTLHTDFPINTTMDCRGSVSAAYHDLKNHLYGDWRTQQRDDLVIAYWPIYEMIKSQCNPH